MIRHQIRQCSFVFSLILLSFLCFALHEARADVKGIPHHEQFASARFPYARYVDGCTTWRMPEGRAETHGVVSFGTACQEHDRCYHTPGATWGDCNQSFLIDLRLACERDLKAELLAQAVPGEPDAGQLHMCYGVADLFFAQVQELAALKRFELAQRQQGRYLAYVATIVEGVYHEVLNRKATPREAAEAIHLLKGDFDLERLRRGLLSSVQRGAVVPPSYKLVNEEAKNSLINYINFN